MFLVLFAVWAGASGTLAWAAAYLLSRGAFPETRFLWVAAATLLFGTAACALLDRRAEAN